MSQQECRQRFPSTIDPQCFGGTLDARPTGLSGNEALIPEARGQGMGLLDCGELFPLAPEWPGAVTFLQ